MANNFRGAIGLTGGAAGDLDYLDGDLLADGDGAIVITSSYTYTYILDASSGAGESSPDIIAPDTNPGTKRWLLKSMSDQDVSVASSPVFAGGEFTAVVQGITPVAGADLVTKEYVDQLIGTFKTFYFSDTASGVGALDYAYPHETGEGLSTEVSSGMGSGDDQLIKGWITEALEPGTTTLHAGVVEFHFHAKKGAANHRTTQLYGVLSRVDADGTSNKTLVATTEISDELSDSEETFHLHANIAADINVADDARLILDLYANVGAGAVDAVVTLYMEGSQDSFWTTRVDAGIWQNHSDKLDDLSTTDATGAELTELTDASETTLHSHAGSSGGYVDRGDPGSVDFAIGDLTTDQTWQDLDLSSIVPAGAVAVSLAVYVVDDLVAQTLQFRRNGNSNSFAVSSINTNVANVAVINNMVVSCDANRVIEYWATTTTWGGINITVLGWWL